MRRLLQQVRGDSVVIGYVLLIVLAVGMAAAVYSYLKFYVPKDQPQCPDGVSLIVKNASCSSGEGKFDITLVNRGLFTVHGAYIKVGDKGKVYKTTINCPNSSNLGFGSCSLYFNDGLNFDPLEPNEIWSKSFSHNLSSGEKDIEIEPIVFVGNNNTRVLCEKAIITRSIECT